MTSSSAYISGFTRLAPRRPYITDGIPARSSTAGFTTFFIALGASSDMNTAVRSPIGTPITIAPRVPNIDVSISGSIPNCSFFAYQVSPNRKSVKPIFPIAGAPDIIIYIVIIRTHATAVMPHTVKMYFITRSVTFVNPDFLLLIADFCFPIVLTAMAAPLIFSK